MLLLGTGPTAAGELWFRSGARSSGAWREVGARVASPAVRCALQGTRRDDGRDGARGYVRLRPARHRTLVVGHQVGLEGRAPRGWDSPLSEKWSTFAPVASLTSSAWGISWNETKRWGGFALGAGRDRRTSPVHSARVRFRSVELEAVAGRSEVQKLALGARAGLLRVEGMLGSNGYDARLAFGGGGAPAGFGAEATNGGGSAEWRLRGGVRAAAGRFEDIRSEWSIAEKARARASSGRVLARASGLGCRLQAEARWNRGIERVARHFEFEATREVSRDLETRLVVRRPSGRPFEIEATVRTRSESYGGFLRIRLPADGERRFALEWRRRANRCEVRASATLTRGTPAAFAIEIAAPL